MIADLGVCFFLRVFTYCSFNCLSILEAAVRPQARTIRSFFSSVNAPVLRTAKPFILDIAHLLLAVRRERRLEEDAT